jgi:uncharacterized ferredoxin-like protein
VRLHRAKLKPVDELPPEWICCDALRASSNRVAGTEVLIDISNSSLQTLTCMFCGATVCEKAKAYKMVNSPFGAYSLVVADTIEIDEKPIES